MKQSAINIPAEQGETMSDAINLDENKAVPLKTSILYCLWCAPKSWTAEEVTAEVNRTDPPGTTNGWVVMDHKKIPEGDFSKGNPLPCSDDPSRQHWFFNC